MIVEERWIRLELIYQKQSLDLKIRRQMTVAQLDQRLKPLLRQQFGIQTAFQLRLWQRSQKFEGSIGDLAIGDGERLIVELVAN
ncbi:hypothetical protein [Convivina intestini]|uniref:Ubiquitin-like protein YukD n=1 Tax=Convivina intestini TaxID=1505726 RepID=A0A2U1D9B5_9LACO|nr:hypothetical protein [Convivina intestini]PVY84270.1 hypothetical protein C7384_10412 [Convivina intestini]CAH1855342.1 hypothetical protein R077811_01031 [Convivina intestini]SDB93699.1 hypothetical protein SAMN05216341_10612 [Leuconostocaceae bacterium R-53105]